MHTKVREMTNVKLLKQQIFNSIISREEYIFLELIADWRSLSLPWTDLLIEKSNDTLAHLAALSGSLKILKYLFENGCESFFYRQNADRKMPLHVAVQSGNLQCVQYLISCKVDVDALKRSDWTPLMLACTKRNLEVIQELVLAGANLRLKNKDGWTAFHIAVREGCLDVIDYLLSVDPLLWDTRSNNGRTPLHTAALHGHLEIVRELISAGCCKDEQDRCGTTCAMDAVSGNHFSLLKYLVLDAKVDAERRDVLGRNVLHLAAQSGSLESVAFLVSNNYIDVNQTTKDGFTPLHFALKENQTMCCELLLQLGAKIFVKEEQMC